MTAADQDPAAAAEPMHDRRLSHSSSSSFGTASESPLPSPAPSLAPSSSAPSSCERVPVVSELERQSSLSSTSSYESFYQIDTAADPAADHEFVPTTLPPAVQTMMAQGQPGVPGYDPKRLPSSMFHTKSTCAAEWSATSDQSLFSIQLENSGDLGGPLYGVGDLYYDSAGVFHRLSSATRLPAVPEVSPSPGSSSGRLCVKDDCGKYGGGSSMGRKSVRPTANGDVSPTLPATLGEGEASATEPSAAADGWCCWPSLWWPSCACRGCDCRCGACRWS